MDTPPKPVESVDPNEVEEQVRSAVERIRAKLSQTLEHGTATPEDRPTD